MVHHGGGGNILFEIFKEFVDGFRRGLKICLELD